MLDDVDNDVPRLYDHPAHVAQYDRLRLGDDENWQEFIQRVCLRSLEAPWDDEEQAEEQAVAPRAGDKLWEIGCTPPPRCYSPGYRLDRSRFPCYGKGPAASQSF